MEPVAPSVALTALAAFIVAAFVVGGAVCVADALVRWAGRVRDRRAMTTRRAFVLGVVRLTERTPNP